MCGGTWEVEGDGGGFLGVFFGVFSFVFILLVALDSFALSFLFFGGSCVHLECESLVLGSEYIYI